MTTSSSAGEARHRALGSLGRLAAARSHHPLGRHRHHRHPLRRARGPSRRHQRLHHHSRASRGARCGLCRARAAFSHRTDRNRRRQARRRARGPHPRDRVAPGLGLEPAGPAAGHAARGLPGAAAAARAARPDKQPGADAVGPGAGARTVLRQLRRGAAAALGPAVVEGAARLRRQHGQQGAGRRHDRRTFRSSSTGRCSRPATATPFRATARSA